MLKDLLNNRNIILASGSPRRRELLQMLGLSFTVKTKPTEEVYPDDLPVSKVSEYLANLKAEAFRTEVMADKSLIVIASDTTVAVDTQILGKPKDRVDAIRMLQMLQGRQHAVYSGVSIISAQKSDSFTASTSVWFRPLSAAEIEYYVDNYKPYDKAGAYAIQEWVGAAAISRMEGSYYNVMGLPTQMLYTKLQEMFS